MSRELLRGKLPSKKSTLVKLPRRKSALVKFSLGEFPWRKFPQGKFPWENSPVSFSKTIFVKKVFLLLKIWFLFTREININIYNRLYLLIGKVDYLSDTFNINKIHWNKDLDLIWPVVCECWYCRWDLFCNWCQQWSIHFTARFWNYLK